ncbi:hypothetical protein MTO96_000119 [Rhipicephalus appendiculatus]
MDGTRSIGGSGRRTVSGPDSQSVILRDLNPPAFVFALRPRSRLGAPTASGDRLGPAHGHGANFFSFEPVSLRAVRGYALRNLSSRHKKDEREIPSSRTPARLISPASSHRAGTPPVAY